MVEMKICLQILSPFSLRKQNILRNPHQLSTWVMCHSVQNWNAVTKRKKGSYFSQVPGDLYHGIKGAPQ